MSFDCRHVYVLAVCRDRACSALVSEKLINVPSDLFDPVLFLFLLLLSRTLVDVFERGQMGGVFNHFDEVLLASGTLYIFAL